jgi:DNA-binding CsgD family transcriptional regulator
VGKITEDQKAFMVKLYASGKTTVQIGQYLQVSTSAGYIAEKIIVFLYGNATVALDRKAASAAKIAIMRDVHLSAECARLDQERARLIQIADWYQDGASLKQIGLRLGVSDVTILHWMEQAGIPRRERHGGRRRMASG